MNPPGLIVDNFAGGGGASTGIEAALGRAVDIAINHDEQAIRMHEVNHPATRHIRNNIWQIDPRDVTGGRHVELAWFSPDCKHFSKAKGGKPREKSIRDLAWVVVLWAEKVRPNVILLENVEEFRTWGPLDDAGQPIKARAGETFDKWCRSLRRAGYKLQFRELRACDYGAPTIRKRFFMIARRDGKPIVWPAPTHGKPGTAEVLAGKLKPWRTAAEIIDWSIPCPSIFERKKPLAEKTLRRIAHGIMKFVVNNPRPFIVPAVIVGCGGRRGQSAPVGMDQPYPTTTTKADACLVAPVFARTAHGDIDRNGKRRGKGQHPADEPSPTITTSQDSALVGVNLAPFASYAQQGGLNRSLEDPLHTVTASDGDHNTVVAAHLIHRGNGERKGQAPRAMEVEKPLGTIVASGQKHAAVCAFMQKFAENGRGVDPSEPLHTVMAGAPRHAVVAAHLAQFSETREGRKLNPGHAVEEPLSTIVQRGPLQAVVASNLVKLRGGDESHLESCGVAVDEPLHTVTASDGDHNTVVAAVLERQFGKSMGADPSEPLPTITAGGGGKTAAVCAFMQKFAENGKGVDPAEPLHTVSAGGTHMAEVRAFLLKYYGTDQDPQLGEPLHTVTTKDRYGLVTVTIEGEEYVIVDIGMRMFTTRELFNAQGFPADYIIDRDISGAPITKTAQVAKCGNSVCPPIAEALVRANCAATESGEEAVAA